MTTCAADMDPERADAEPRSNIDEDDAEASPDRDCDVLAEEPNGCATVAVEEGDIISPRDAPPHDPPPPPVPVPRNSNMPARGAQQQVPYIDPGLPSLLFSLVLAVSLVGWLYAKQRKQEKEWLLSSQRQLELMRQRNLGSVADNRESTPGKISASLVKALVKKVDVPKEKVELDSQQKTISIKIETKAGFGQSMSKLPDRISEIRAEQQNQLLRNTKASHHQRRRQQQQRKQILHTSLNHRVADEEYHRRRQAVVAEEVRLRREKELTQQQQQEHQALNELEETERRAVLQQQDAEYHESLLRDRERTRRLAAENEQNRRRERAIEQAQQRLVTAGVRYHRGSVPGDEAPRARGHDERVRVRLCAPSGQRVEGEFAPHHALGLVYDLALVMLHEEQLLRSREGTKEDWDDGRDDGEDDGSHGTLGNAADPALSYVAIDTEWKQLFQAFSLVSTFPRRTLDKLGVTLEGCGLRRSVTLMIVVEAD